MLPSMNIILAHSLYKHKAFQDPEERVLAQPKLDGIFFKLNRTTMSGMTKDGKRYDATFLKKRYTNSFVKYQYGELVYVDRNGFPTRDRHKVMIVLRKQKGWEDLVKDIRFFVFNVEFTKEALASFELHGMRETYLEVLKDHGRLSDDQFVPTKPVLVKDLPRITKEFERSHVGPLEGLVVVKESALHHQFFPNKKVPNYHPQFFKIKHSYDATLCCVGFKPHSKQKDWIGSLICETADQLLRVPIGMGLKLAERQLPFSAFEGKCIEVEFEDLHEKSRSLVSARIKYIREDGAPDTLEKLIKRTKGR